MYAAMYMGEGWIMEHERVKNTLMVKISGELDHCSAERIRREMDRLIADPGIKKLVLDLENMSFMDSSGIGVILGRYREIRQRGGEVAVKNMNPQVEKVFLLSGMNQVIKMI